LGIWVEVAQAALNFIVVNALTTSNQAKTVTDMKTDLRTTKEDLMQEIKESGQEIMRMIEEQESHTRDVR
jgi:hypothetical protein